MFRLFIAQHGNVHADRVTKLMVAEFQASLKASGKRPATVVSYCAALSSVFGSEIARACGVVRNPCRGLRKPKLDRRQPTYWTRAELAQLHAAIDVLPWRDPIRPLQWHGMIQLADDGGLRIGEILNLRWADIELDPHEGPPLVRIGYRPHRTGQCWEWGTKGRRDRAVTLPDRSVALLRRLQVTCPWPYPFLPQARCAFLLARAERLSVGVWKRPYSNLYVYWNRIKNKAEVKSDGAFHRLRRTAATELAEHLTVPQLQAMFGWQDMSTPQRYVGLRAKAQRDAEAKAQTERQNHQVS